jgi:signal transduction histidine kinase
MPSTIHEMRNQLAVAVANIEAFIDGKLPPSTERLGSVLDALNKLNTLMNELRPAASSEPAGAVMQPIDVCALIANESLAMEAAVAAAGLAFEVDMCTHQHAECARFRCDATQVSQVIKNVVLNAVKYTGRGGRVRLSCHREPGVLALEISDNGPGVPVAERQTIFEKGVRGAAAQTAAGSGLGLAVVRGILEAHGGTVAVAESAIGGARFVIHLPGDTTGTESCRSCVDRSPLLHESAIPVV